MNQQNLKQAYSRQNWQTWLQDIFKSQVQLETQAESIEIDKNNIKSVQRFASVKLADGKNIAVLDIETRAGLQIARNRVGLRELVVKFIDHAHYHGILAFYHSEDTAQTGYRLSFISSEPTIDAEGNFSTESTAPKRFTYVLGESEKTKTPADRLKIIANKHGNATLKDIKDAFSVETLTKEFYAELSNWYFWALQNVDFPDELGQNKEINNSTSVIRLITRLMFVWFLKQKHLINEKLFDTSELGNILNYNDKTGSTYYKAILQNLFFATLNTEMGDKRKFVNRQSGIQGFYRYERFFKDKERFLELTKDIPFLNGGLFENLDKNVGEENEIRIDCFSNRIDKEQLLKVPDYLFFAEEKQVDLNTIYGTKGKTYNVRGLIKILESYNFTIEENTATDVEVALDPELLGKVFENLLASYNPETQTTARKQTGSFYTPREIVDYMVNESLAAYLQEKVGDDWENNPQTISALNRIKILDPACGSGAFPMGALHRMVQILQKLDPNNKLWKQRQIDIAEKIEDTQAREAAILNINEAFEKNGLDYGRKLFLIENCIFGIDIQPIAVQISKLRFFISLICEQTPNPTKSNFGIRPLPNLETNFVAANTLIGLEKPQQLVLGMNEVEQLEKQLADVRHKHFSARTPETKRKYRDQDRELRTRISEKLKEIGFNNDSAEKIAAWNPYDQNTHAEWFDAEWMFDINDGFDIVIGNPPYVNVEKIEKVIKDNINKFRTAYQKYDLYVLFYEKAIDLLKNKGILSYITSNKFLSQGYGLLLRKEFLKYHINSIINFNYDVFEAATVRTCIFIMQKQKQVNENVKIIDINTENDKYKFSQLDYNYLNQKIFNGTEENNFRINLTKDKIKILTKIKENTIRVDDIFSVNYGLRPNSEKLGLKKEDFIYEENPMNIYKKYFEGKDMGYWIIKQSSFIDYQPNVMYNAMFKELFENEKLVGLRTLSDIGKLRFIYDNDNFYCNDSVVVLVLWYLFENVDNQTIKRNITKEKIENSKRFSYAYIQGVLNSKLIKFYVNELLYDGTHFYPNHIKSLPIKDISFLQQQSLITPVNYILLINKLGEDIQINEYVPNSHLVQSLEEVIDACVYELYFEEDFKNAGISFMQYVTRDFESIEGKSESEAIVIIHSAYQKLRKNDNEIRNNLKLMDIKLADLIMPIKSVK